METRPELGRTRPAMAERVVLLPEPEGPKRTVTPGGTSNATSRANPFVMRRLTFRVSPDIASSGELVDGVEDGDGDGGEGQDHAQRGGVAVLLDGVVDGERRGLRLARDVAGDHEGDAEVPERARKGQH